jgi:hypothetical protein
MPKMNTRFFSTLCLIALLVAACAPTASPLPGEAPPSAATSASPLVIEASATPLVAAALETPVPSPLPVATSRGPDLHATDPATVNLAAGQLQFVEFFRFT